MRTSSTAQMPDSSAVRTDEAVAGRFLTFRAGSGQYALPAESVAEVLDVPAVARVPQSPGHLLGIANLRGHILPVVDLNALLGSRERDAARSSRRAIVLDAEAPVALVVEAVETLVAVDAHRLETNPAALAAEPGERLSGAFEAEGSLIKVLDIEALLATAFEHRARARPARASRPIVEARRRNRADESDVTLLVAFEVSGQEFALDLETVQEVMAAPPLPTQVPRADSVVVGVTSLRDHLLPLLSLRALLGLAPVSEADGREKVVVARIGRTRVGLLADRARTILRARSAAIDALPAVLAARTGGEARIKAIYRADEGRRLVSILAPDQLFREDVMKRIEQDAAEPVASHGQGDAARREALSFVVFRLGEDEFALPIAAVEQVVEVPDRITRLPKTPEFLEGVVNLRGEVLPIIDQRRRFDMPALHRTERRRLVVVKSAAHRAGLIVDDVSDVLRVPEEAVEPAPELTEQIARLVRGVVNLPQQQRLVLMLDPAELLTRAERGLLDTLSQSMPQAET